MSDDLEYSFNNFQRIKSQLSTAQAQIAELRAELQHAKLETEFEKSKSISGQWIIKELREALIKSKSAIVFLRQFVDKEKIWAFTEDNEYIDDVISGIDKALVAKEQSNRSWEE